MRATRAVGLAFLVPAIGLGLYLCANPIVGVRSNGMLDLFRFLAAFLLGSAAAIGILCVAVLLRLGPPIVYSSGIDVRDHFLFAVILGRTYHSWEEFRALEIKRVAVDSREVRRVVMRRQHGPGIAFDETDYGPEFVDILESRLRLLPGMRVDTIP